MDFGLVMIAITGAWLAGLMIGYRLGRQSLLNR